MKMKKILCLLLGTLVSLLAFSQTTITGNRIVAKDGLYVVNNWLDSIQRSGAFNSHRTVPTSQAVADYIQATVTGRNFAENDLRFTGNRYHSAAGFNLTIDSIKKAELVSRGFAFNGRKKLMLLTMDGQPFSDVGDFQKFSVIYRNAADNADSVTYQLRYNAGFGACLEAIRTVPAGTWFSRLQLQPGFATLRATDSIMVGSLPIATSADTIMAVRGYNFIQNTNSLIKVPVSAILGGVTANNGLTKTGNNITGGGALTGSYRLDGTTNAHKVYVRGFSNSYEGLLNVSVSDASAGSSPIAIQARDSSTGGYAMYAVSNNGIGIFANGKTNGIAATVGSSGTGAAIVGTSYQNDNQPGLEASAFGGVSNTTAILPGLDLTRKGSIIMGNGAGIRQRFLLPFNTGGWPGGYSVANTIEAKVTNITGANFTSDLLFTGVKDSTQGTYLTLKGGGQVQLNQYTSGSTFKSSDTTNVKPIGTDASGNLYRMNGWPGGGSQTPLRFVQTSTTSVVGNDNETTLIGSGSGTLTIPANTLVAGKTYRLTVRGKYSTDASNPAQSIYRIKFGSTIIMTTGNAGLGINKVDKNFEIGAEITCRTIGATGTVMCQGMFFTEDGPGAKGISNGFATTTIDTTVPNTLDFTIDMTDGSAGNSVYVYILVFEEVN